MYDIVHDNVHDIRIQKSISSYDMESSKLDIVIRYYLWYRWKVIDIEFKMEPAGNPTVFKMESAGNPTEFKLESVGNPTEFKMEPAGNPTEFKLESAGNPTEFKMESAGNPT